MPSPSQISGQIAEDVAAKFIQSKGYLIIARHVTSRFGEIDILARDGDALVAVEVKARRNRKFGTAIEGVTRKKLEALEMVLTEYIQRHTPATTSWRIDVVTVEYRGDEETIAHLKGVGLDRVDTP